MSHFAINILSLSSASANACITRWSKWPSEQMAELVDRPVGDILVVGSLTAGSFVPSHKRSKNGRSRINLNALDLCGIAAIGDTFI